MEFEIVYRLTDNLWFLLLFLLPLVFLFLGLALVLKPSWFRNLSKFGRLIIGPIFITISLLVTVFFMANIILQYNNIVKPYMNNEYLIVEGEVQDFVPGSDDWGNDTESFTVNGIKFEYSQPSAAFGYRRYAENGGVIKGNGQYVRIGYVIYDDENVIVLIEIPVEEETS